MNGNLEIFVYAAPIDNEEASHHRIVGACQIIRNYPGHMLILTFFLFWHWELVPKIGPDLTVTPCA
jgi:hypothetical protein